jgi:long-chain acyl-CoA synthetase
MSPVAFIIDRLSASPEMACLAWRDRTLSRQDLSDMFVAAQEWIGETGIEPGDPVVLMGNYSPQTVALFLALIESKAILIPLVRSATASVEYLINLVSPTWIVTVGTDDGITVEGRTAGEDNEYYATLRTQGTPGLVLFTSGSTGEPKAVIHDVTKLLGKFAKARPGMVMLNFLMFDHWGGLNTLLHGLSSRSLVVLPESRNPDDICQLIEQREIELLPSTPTFLNMLLISRAYEKYDLSTLKLITYGAEPMPASTLKALIETFPGVELRQTYGLIELGVLRAQSKSSDSLWVRIGGEGYDLRVIDGLLQIKAESAMLGYLNAPSPFTDDGYFITGDRVEVAGDYMRILGRDSELINVGGQKVFPAEVETVLLEHETVEDVVVYGESNPITGNIVCATVHHRPNIDIKTARQDIKRFCNERLDSFKTPVKLRFVETPLFKDRFKRLRHNPESAR